MSVQLQNSSGDTPQVSVVIPAYNRADVIGRAISSVLRQSMQDFEVIVVDDASTDTTAEVVRGFEDPRIVYIKHETNRFAGAARNTGLNASRGRYIAFLDSDDEWLPRKLELQLNILDALDDTWGCLYSGATIFKGTQKPVQSVPKLEGELVRELLSSEIVIWTPTFIFRRSCLDKVNDFDESLIRAQDRDFYIRLLSHFQLAKLEECVVNIYLDTNKGLADVAAKSREQLLEKHDGLLNQLGSGMKRRTHATQWFLQALQYFREKRYADGLRYFTRSLRNDPGVAMRRSAKMVIDAVGSKFA